MGEGGEGDGGSQGWGSQLSAEQRKQLFHLLLSELQRVRNVAVRPPASDPRVHIRLLRAAKFPRKRTFAFNSLFS